MTINRLPHNTSTLSPDLKARLIDTLVNLIRIDSRSAIANTNHIIAYLNRNARQYGLHCAVIGPTSGPDSLVITIKGKNSRKDGLILLSHLDTADWEEKSWLHHPLSATRTKDGKIYGRGAIDCKSLSAIWLQLCIEFSRSESIPEKDICFIATSDEESGKGEGINWVLENSDIPDRCKFAINEGGGYICTSENKQQKIITCQYGEKGRIKIHSAPRFDRYESIIHEKGVFGSLRHFSMVRSQKKAQKQFRTFTTKPDLIHCYFSTVKSDNDKTMLYNHPAADFRKLMSMLLQSGSIEQSSSFQTESQANASPLNTRLYRIIENCSRKAGFTQVFPSITRGYCDNRFLRKKGIITYGFFPVGLREDLSSMHDSNECIHQNSLFDAYQLLSTIVKSYVY